MNKFLKRYTDALTKYKNGEFGNTQLTLYDILSKVDETDLLEKMTLNEIQTLTYNSSGLLKQMFHTLEEKKRLSIEKMKSLEDELNSLGIKEYYNSEDVADKDLAKKLRLKLIFCKPNEMSEDVEATLSPSPDKQYLGTIKVLDNANITKFSYIREILHYLRDVGKGKKVARTFTRKKQEKTDSDEEKDINYLTAATLMPIEQISKYLVSYEKMSPKEEKEFISHIAQKYGQTENEVLRRIIEVRSLMDYCRRINGI